MIQWLKTTKPMQPSPTDLYSLQTAPGMRAGKRPPVAPTKRLQSQIERGFIGLRFKYGLEPDFCRYLRVSGRLSRASLVLMSFFGMVMILLIDRPLLGLPDELLWPTRLFELGIMMPTTLACGLFCWYWPQSRFVEPVMLGLFAGMNIGMVGQRVVASRYGFDVPFELVGVTIVAMFSLARIRFWLMLPAAVIVAAAVMITEVLFVDAGPSARYHVFSASLLLFIGVVGGYSSEYFIRWTWLNGTLLRYVSRTDSLTGLLNRQALEEALERAHAHARREDTDYAIAMIDIDAFGAYNEHYGHQAGDVTLRRVARELKASARRPQDVCGRFGGEEFVLLWMGGSPEELTEIAEDTRAAVEDMHITHAAASNVAPWVTVSIGLCHVSPDDGDVSVQDVLRKADQLLYAAKASGRNRVVSARFRIPDEQRPLKRKASG